MSNGDVSILDEVETLLAADRIDPDAVLRMMLKMQKYICVTIPVHRDRIEKLERKSIILWIESHPKMTTGLVVGYLLLNVTVDLNDLMTKAITLIKP